MKRALDNQENAGESGTIGVEHWLGRLQAFSLIAERCSPAEVESLRQIRDAKLYRDYAASWSDFCARELGASRRKVDRTIGLLQEFGPAYFYVARLGRIAPEEYRAIAASFTRDSVNLDGVQIALLPENTRKVNAAVGELLRRAEFRSAETKGPTGHKAVLRCEAAARMLDEVRELDPLERIELAEVLVRLRKLAAMHGVKVMGS